MSFLDNNIIHEKDKFTTSVYHKPTFSRIYTHFDSFLPSCTKIGLLHKLLYRSFWIYSDLTKFHLELIKLIDVFKNNDYPENFFLVLPYLGPLSLQTRTKLRKSLNGILNCYKSQIVFKSQNKFAKVFRFKDRIPRELTSAILGKIFSTK